MTSKSLPSLYYGIDPDLHTAAIAGIVHFPASYPNAGLWPFGAWVVKSKGDKAGDAVLSMTDAFIDFIHLTQLLPQIRTPYDPWPCFVIEHQDVTYTGKSGKNPQDTLNLSTAAGAMLAALRTVWHDPRNTFMLPSPKKWKQQQPKHINQGRTFDRFGWTDREIRGTKKDRYVFPHDVHTSALMGRDTWTMQDWKHLGDAFGLARYGAEHGTRAT